MLQPDSTPNDEYILKIVFSGIVPLIPEYNGDGHPKRLWALVSNLTDPSRLPGLNGHHLPHIHKHVSRLMFDQRHLVSAGGRNVKTGKLCVESRTLHYVTMENEDWRLEADSASRSLEIIHGELVPPVPCAPGSSSCPIQRPQAEQEIDFGWTIDLDDVARRLVREGSQTPRLQKALFVTPYHPSPSYPLLSSRFVLDRGTVSALSLDRDGQDGAFQVSQFNHFDENNKPYFRRTVATRVQVALLVKGEVALVAKPLDGSRGEPQPLRLTNGGDSEVVVHVENHPDMDCQELARASGDGHFLVNYCLYERPQDFVKLLGPVPHPNGPTLNAQCSPPRFNFPG